MDLLNSDAFIVILMTILDVLDLALSGNMPPVRAPNGE